MQVKFDQNLIIVSNITEIDEQVLALRIKHNQTYDEEDGEEGEFKNINNFTWSIESFSKS